MKILHIIHGFAPLLGGAENACRRLFREMAAQDQQLLVFTSNLSRYSKQEEMDGFEIYRCRSMKRKMGEFTIPELGLFVFSGLFSIRKIVTRFQPDILHAHFVVPSGILAWWAARKTQLPYLVTSHGADMPGQKEKSRTWAFRGTMPLWRTVVEHADAVCTLSPYLMQGIESHAKISSGYVVPYGIDVPESSVSKRPSQGNRIRLICVGRLLREKGQEHLLTAFAKIRREWNLDAELILIGDGPDRRRLTQRTRELKIDPWTTFRGFMNTEQINAEYDRADLQIIPSLEEAFGLVALEGMSHGLPIVGTRSGGLQEIILEGKTGFLVEPANSDPLADALKKLIENQPLRQNMGQHALRVAKENYSWKNSAELYLKIYESLLSRSRKSGNPH